MQIEAVTGPGQHVRSRLTWGWHRAEEENIHYWEFSKRKKKGGGGEAYIYVICNNCQEWPRSEMKAISKDFSSARGLGGRLFCFTTSPPCLIPHCSSLLHSAQCIVHSAWCTMPHSAHTPIHIYLWTSPLFILQCPAFKQSLRRNLTNRMKWTIFVLEIGAFLGIAQIARRCMLKIN